MIDDAYLGGERPDGKAGRGSENKVPIVAAVVATLTNSQNSGSTPLSNLQTNFSGTFHAFIFAKYGKRYLGAFCLTRPRVKPGSVAITSLEPVIGSQRSSRPWPESSM